MGNSEWQATAKGWLAGWAAGWLGIIESGCRQRLLWPWTDYSGFDDEDNSIQSQQLRRLPPAGCQLRSWMANASRIIIVFVDA